MTVQAGVWFVADVGWAWVRIDLSIGAAAAAESLGRLRCRSLGLTRRA